MLNRQGIMSDQELRMWQQLQMNKCRCENICNKVTEIKQQLQNPTNQEPAALELEESAISMAIAAHGLVGSGPGDGNDEIANRQPSISNATLSATLNRRALLIDLYDFVGQNVGPPEWTPDQQYSGSYRKNAGRLQRVRASIQRRQERLQRREQVLQDAVSTAIKNKGLGPKG